MKSGKSKALLDEAKQLEEKNLTYICFKPVIDNRNGDYIYSRYFEDDFKLNAIRVECAKQVYNKIVKKKTKCHAVLIDEIMLFDSEILGVIDVLKYEGIDLIAAGLDLDFRKMPFQLSDWGMLEDGYAPTRISMNHVINQFETVYEHVSQCDVCGKNAKFTQRLIDGEPASLESAVVMIGDEEYQARCNKHHVCL